MDGVCNLLDCIGGLVLFINCLMGCTVILLMIICGIVRLFNITFKEEEYDKGK